MDAEARKLSPEARRAFEEEGDRERRVDVLMATHGRLEPAQRERLAEIGCRVGTVAGDVVTADLPAHALGELAALEFVRFVEVSRPLYAERPGPAAQS
jgi:hypothetical protein